MTIAITGEITAAQDLNDDLVIERTGLVRAGPTAITMSGANAIKIFGSVYGTEIGIRAVPFAQLSIGSTGIVHGEVTAVSVSWGAVIHNAGQISTLVGSRGTGILAEGSANAITNTGSIEAYYGIRAGMGGREETIINTGTILSSGGVGIEVNGAGWITNGGTIQSLQGVGIRLLNTPSGSNNWITNTGTIRGATAIEGSDRIDVITNTGNIIGTVDLGDGNDRYEGRNGYTDGLILLGNGNDTFRGGAAWETIVGGAGDDLIDGGSGDADAVQFLGNGNIAVDLRISGPQDTGEGRDTLIDIEQAYTGNGADRLTGNSGDNGFHAGGGNDTLDGGLRNDTIWGGDGIDTLAFSGSTAATVDLGLVLTPQNTGYGLDVLYQIENVSGGSGADRLTGDGGANVLAGNGGKDRLSGGDGDDTLTGGAGNDILTGGAGRDVFVFDAARSKNVDTIGNYAVADDTIHLQNSVYTKIGASGVLASKAFWSGKKAHDASDRIIYDKGTGALYYDADGTGKAAQIKIGQLTKNLKMSAAEFFVI
ncbi:calcium-binding protein [Microvirga sp. BSC39]|uniref:calcium-binding protein n=1 Tax=Microvirga sp. BSC39 TaxID=1549810 RepID=UPI0004E9601B|nr:calcium-binding protein [Microvirga sp. BSC39]KFG69740.1 hypothetical protein JH26_08750 [Microvirga sp. BSC39]